MYLSPIFLIFWAVMTVGAFAFGYRARRSHDRNLAYLRQAKKSLQKLESKNGKLWYEVMKSRAAGDLYRANEVTVTNAGQAR